MTNFFDIYNQFVETGHTQFVHRAHITREISLEQLPTIFNSSPVLLELSDKSGYELVTYDDNYVYHYSLPSSQKDMIDITHIYKTWLDTGFLPPAPKGKSVQGHLIPIPTFGVELDENNVIRPIAILKSGKKAYWDNGWVEGVSL